MYFISLTLANPQWDWLPNTTEIPPNLIGCICPGVKTGIYPSLEIGTKNINFLENLTSADQFRLIDLFLAITVYLPVRHSHCARARFTVLVWCSAELSDEFRGGRAQGPHHFICLAICATCACHLVVFSEKRVLVDAIQWCQVNLKNKPKVGNFNKKQAQLVLGGKFNKTKNQQQK